MKPEAYVTSMEFEQEADCCQPGEWPEQGQSLVVRHENGGTKRDDEFYVIETERWAFDDIESLVALLRQAGCREKTEPADAR